MTSSLNSKENVDAINQLAFDIRNTDTSRSIALSKEAQKRSNEIHYPKGNATALANEAFCYVQITDYDLALEKLFEALKIFEELKNEEGVARVHYNLCLVYFRFSDFNNGLESITKALAYYQKVNDKLEIARCMFQQGYLYLQLEDKASAIEYFNQSLLLNRETHNKAGEAAALMGFGQTYLALGEYVKSKEYLLESMTIREEINDRRGNAAAMNAYMTLCYETGQYEEAEKVSLKGLKLATELGDKMGIARFMKDLGNIYIKQNKIDEAEHLLLDALEVAEKINLRMALSPVHFSLYEIYQMKGDYQNSLKHYKRYHEVAVQIANTDAAMKAKSFQFVAKIENAQQEAEINRLKNVELKNAYDQIAEKNKSITDSITYAKRIQQAKLPKKDEIINALPQSFVLFKPKDIVSGDFYFFHKASASPGRKGEELVFIAAVDCTGHGVPGAFMSIIGSEKLNEAVLQSIRPSNILQMLNRGIKTSLRQSDSEESTRDGMDIALCVLEFNSPNIDEQGLNLKYAGANLPLWIIRKGLKEVEEIKATKRAIGGLTDDEQHFDMHELKLEQGDVFYIFSDGYADTFGGPNGKKLTTKKFKEILVSIQDKSMKEQEKHLNDFIDQWKEGVEQLDDILVIGVQI